MGLDISHGAWHGAYSAFTRWRTEIARLAGIKLSLMEGFYGFAGGSSWDDVTKGKDLDSHFPFGYYFKEIHPLLPLKWDSLKPDPLHVLLDHSDCDGDISPFNAAKIADRLQELLPLLPSGDAGGHIGNWRDKTTEFITGCRLAASNNEPLHFA